jgi:hypothetical protein
MNFNAIRERARNFARILNSPLGDFRGKVGGVVGSRNKAGSFVRTRVKPTNPKSPAQVAARQNFRSAAMGWKTLTAALRQNWEIFAKAGFNSLKKVNKGQYSGNQVYTAIQGSIGGSNNSYTLASLSVFAPTPVVASLTKTPISVTNVAPLKSVQPNIQDATAGSYPLQLVGVYMTTANIVALDIRCTDVGGNTPTAPKMIDGSGNQFGYVVYFSEALTFSGKKAGTPLRSQAGFTGIFPNTALGAGAVAGFRITFDATNNVIKWHQAPALGQIYQATVVAIGSNGTAAIVGKSFVTVAASLPAAPTA